LLLQSDTNRAKSNNGQAQTNENSCRYLEVFPQTVSGFKKISQSNLWPFCKISAAFLSYPKNKK
jgi:hypothetical protein